MDINDLKLNHRHSTSTPTHEVISRTYSWSVYLSVSLSIYLSMRWSVELTVGLYICLLVYLSICKPLFLVFKFKMKDKEKKNVFLNSLKREKFYPSILEPKGVLLVLFSFVNSLLIESTCCNLFFLNQPLLGAGG